MSKKDLDLGKARKGKAKERKRRTKPEVVDDDTESLTSASSEETVAGTEETVDVFAETVELLTEKRPSIRVNALQTVIKYLTSEVLQEQLLSRMETLQLYLSNIIRKSSSDEVTLASRALSLVMITLGEESASFGHAFLPLLVTASKNTAKGVSIRKACIQAMGTIHLIVVSPPESSEALGVYEQLYSDSKSDPILIAEALLSWSLVASTLSIHQLGGPLLKKYVPVLSKFLEHKSLEVRSAAGEAIALLYSAMLDMNEMEMEVGEIEAGESESRKTAAKYMPDIEALTKQLKTLSKEGSKHRAKKDTMKQKSFFREVVRTFEEGDVPIEKIVNGSRKHEIVGWAKVKQLSHLRGILGTGFQVHFKQNELLSEMFEISEENESGVEKIKGNKKLERERQDKQKSTAQEIEKQRKNKTAFLFEEE